MNTSAIGTGFSGTNENSSINKLFDLTKRDTLFSVFALLFCVFTSIFGIFGGYALGYTVSCVLLQVLFSIYFLPKGKGTFFAWVCFFLSLLISSIFFLTSNGSVRFFGAVSVFVLSLAFNDSLIGEKREGNRQTLALYYSAISSVKNVSLSVRSLFSGKNGTGKVAGKALVGVLCSVPLLVVVLPLLISSDAAFEGMMSSLFAHTSGTVGKIIFGSLLSLFVISYAFSLKYKRFSSLRESGFSGIETVYIVSFLSVISLLYLMYLFSQLAYFFSAFRGFLPDGEITYAQYARKGFFEMCMIAVINLGIVFLALFLSKKKNGKAMGAVRAVTTFISLFTLVIIVTSISKMFLYIGAYGMTVLRLTTSSFMLFLFIVFVSVILRIYFVKINVVKISLVFSALILFLLGAFNVNAVCAKYNYENYKNGNLGMDVYAMYSLGDEGIEYVVKLASDENVNVSEQAKYYLSKAYRGDYFEGLSKILYEKGSVTEEDLSLCRKERGLHSFCIPSHRAYEALEAFYLENPQVLTNNVDREASF